MVTDIQLQDFTAALTTRYDDFDILQVRPRIWPHIFVLEVEEGSRFRVAVTGSHIDEHLHRNCAGLYLNDIVHGPKSNDVLGFFRKTIAEGKALKVKHILALQNRPQLTIFATAHPYFDRTGAPSHVIGTMLFTQLKRQHIHGIRLEIQELQRSFSPVD